MMKRYNLVIIGTGTAAMVAAMRVRAAGWSVAVIDFRPFGGTCALRGCDPKKMLVGGATAADHARRMHGKGIAGETRIDWPALIAFKRTFTDPIPEKHRQRYADKDIDTYHGLARFTGRQTLDVEGEPLEAEYILIASGAEPMKLGIAGEEHLITHEEFLELETLPRRIILVGGGFIAFEFAHTARRAGAEVTVLEQASRVLGPFDPDLVGWLVEKSRDLGIDVRTGTAVETIDRDGGSFTVRAAAHGNLETFQADLVVHGAGRVPALDALDLDAAGVAHERGRIKLNEFLQSVSNPAVYAAGDAAQVGPPLTPVSSHDGKVVASNLLNGNHQEPNYTGVPSVVFTIPPLAAVGLGEAEARRQGYKFRMQSEKASDWFTARQAAEPAYGFKVLIDEETDRVLGAHLLGPHVDEVINIFALAIRHGLTAEQLKTTMFAYPTGASDIGYML
ncbi:MULTISPECIES: dihydrolipoyl dehydrogenase family protein [Acinetobacter]|uniref:NAD(P)/FAD-dependent oxidoreductase n=5 Tax=Acinetobacter TaxID=469 RepID=A0A2S2F953_9GAMM|nr:MULTISPECIES: NAD(P)/FAD-dependent oxidoreductase [Acinetobacter]AZB99717.1 NAD(P)/FAD-dependent oxidoreductase [Acinetobacter pittii]NWK50233.1 NAD(P)/FAD-dependent oxidoreductase [Acinetobacter sp. SwsAc7]ALV74855.1 pyridine nucleotide-disulfide oxidoreductase [Acinetobacter johnsonii XBB1]AWL27440.1 NAD(P)/FAD-dependent oxidoreductase [Acinetobacter defluvii]MEB8382911.1 NAD(P)/FAD-dependent oxidoreductase [Acinetobacter junii]